MKHRHTLLALVPSGVLLFFAAAALAVTALGPVRIDTPGFSVIFLGRWDVEWNKTKTRIIASVNQGEPPMVVMESAFLPSSPKPEEKAAFEEFRKKNHIDTVLSSDKLKYFIAHSTWRSERKTVTKPDGTGVEKMDMESVIDAPQKQVICVFLRNFHGAHTEVYFAQIELGTCEKTRPLLEEVATRIKWK